MSFRVQRAGTTALVCALAVWGCNEQQLAPGVSRDLAPPTVQILKTAGDTMDVKQGLTFSVSAQDNLALKSISIVLTGGLNKTYDVSFTQVTTSTTVPISESFPANTTVGGDVVITVTASDGAGNAAQAVVDSVFLKNDQALTVRLLTPQNNAQTSAGRSLPIEVMAKQVQGVRKLGWITSGAFASPIGDSLTFTSGFSDSLVFADTLTLPASPTTGTFQITAFAVDSSLRRATATPVTILIQSTANDVTPPTVTFQVDKRVEVDDTITVTATDPSGIERLGWTATDLNGNVVGGDSATGLSTSITNVTRRWALGFGFANLPQSVIVSAFAVDGNGNRGSSVAPSAPAPSAGPQRAAQANGIDTILVVNGVTRPLPNGGRVVDAIFNSRLNAGEVYLTNVERNRLEVFQLADSSFDPAGIAVGAQPVGIALWPRDTLGDFGDTVVVANSGGTNLSIVDVALRRERRRHKLPNFQIQSVQTELDAATGTLKLKITEYDFSDRPLYLGMTCRPTTGSTNCAADSIYAVYSTTGTAGQAATPENFVDRGTVRWEDLTSATPHSHFFWEQAAVSPSPDADTLQIIIDRGPGTTQELDLSAACGVTVTLLELGFADTTLVRNSGNFTHALVGEGGTGVDPATVFARAIGYDATDGVQITPCDTIVIDSIPFAGQEARDLGISPSIRVRDFVVNTSAFVKSIGVNFNGLTNLIRMDSIYIFDEGLRLQGIIGVGGANPGMDLNFNHAFDAGAAGTPTFGGGLNPNDRLIFAASENAEIDVYDTFFYGKVTTIPIKDPIIGPLRVSKNAGGQQVLVGATKNGVVVIVLPAITNIFQAPAAWGGEHR